MKHPRKRQIKAAKKNRLRHMDTIDLSEIIDIPKGLYVLKRKSGNGRRYTFRSMKGETNEKENQIL